MGLELNRHGLLLGHAQPPFDHGDHVGERNGHLLADDDDERRGNLVRQVQRGTQRFDRSGKRRQSAGKPRAGEMGRGLPRLLQRQRTEVDCHSVESGVTHPVELLGHRCLGRGEPIHCP